jgi:hypothetical protein
VTALIEAFKVAMPVSKVFSELVPASKYIDRLRAGSVGAFVWQRSVSMFAFAMTLQVTLLAERFIPVASRLSANQWLNVDVLKMVLETFACCEGTLLRCTIGPLAAWPGGLHSCNMDFFNVILNRVTASEDIGRTTPWPGAMVFIVS